MTRTSPVFTGVAVALVTFFDEHGHVDARLHVEARRPPRRARCASDRRGRHDRRGLAPLDEGAAAAARRRAGGRARPTCRSSSAPATWPPGSACPTSPGAPPSTAPPPRSTLSPHHGDVREFYGEVVDAAGPMPVLAYHWPTISPPGITIEDLKALQGRRPQGLHRRPRAPARRAGPLPPADLHGQRGHHRLRRACSAAPGAILAAANLEPELCIDAFAGQHPGPEGPAVGPQGAAPAA